MNRSFFSLIILIIIIACIPWADGWLFKKKYLEFIEAINNDTNFNVNVSSYHLGWLSSDAVIDVSTREGSISLPLSNQPLNIHFTIAEHIKHGPLIFESWNNAPMAAFAVISGAVLNTQSEKIIDITTKATFAGNFISQIAMYGLEWPISFGKLTWEGLTGNMECSYRNHHINRTQAQLKIGSLSVQSPIGTLGVPNSTYQSEMVFDPRGFWNGSQVFTVPHITLNVLDYEVNSLNVNSSQSFGANDNNYFMTAEMMSQEIATSDLTITPFDLKIELTGLDLNTLIALTKESNVESFKQLFPQILTKDTLFSGNLNIGTNHGKFILAVKSQLSKKAFPIKNVQAIPNNINYEIHIRVDVNLVDYFIELSEAQATTVNTQVELSFTKQIEFLQEEKLISVYAASQLKDLEKKPLPYEAYLTLIERLASSKEISSNAVETLKSLYTLTQPKAETNVPAPQGQNLPQSQLRGQLDTWIKQGYVFKNGDEYNASIVYQDGIFKVNGLTFQPPPKLSSYLTKP